MASQGAGSWRDWSNHLRGDINAAKEASLFEVASGGKHGQNADIGDLYKYQELDELIGRPDVTVHMYMSKGGMQLDFTGEWTGRVTVTWNDLLDPRNRQATQNQRPNPLVDVTEKYSKVVCRCREQACVASAYESVQRASAEAEAARRGGTEADAKAIREASEKASDCVRKIVLGR